VCDISAEDAYSSMTPNPIFAFFGGPCCPTLDFVLAFWIVFDAFITHQIHYELLAVYYNHILKEYQKRTYVTKSHRSHKFFSKYKSENG
jgi:hypothetical protein